VSSSAVGGRSRVAWAPTRVLAQASAPPAPKMDMVDVLLEGSG